MLYTTILLSLREIARHKLRSFLTTLGIIIGVFSVITMVTLGNGISASVQESISSLGTNTLTIFPSSSSGRGGGAPPPSFDQDDIDALREQIGGVRSVAGQVTSSALAVRNAQNWTTTITGSSNEYFDSQNLEFASGRPFTASAASAAKSSACSKSVTAAGSTIRTIRS